jgi:hypothetical protein
MFKLTKNGLESTTGEAIDDVIDRLERLTTDLKALRDGAIPSEAGILDEAPGIDAWSVAEDHGAVRTISRWYKLGRPIEDAGTTHS